MEVLKGETRIGIGSHIGMVFLYESFPEHGIHSALSWAFFWSSLAPRGPGLFKIEKLVYILKGVLPS